jgi:hypothetical protein
MQTIITIYVLVASLGSAVFLFAGLRGYRRHARDLWPMPLDDIRRDNGPFDGDQPADVGSACSVALNRVMPRLRDRGVWLDVAVRPGLLVRETGHNLADVLEQMLIAMTGGSNQRVLLSAAPHGGQIAITVTNDAPQADVPTLQGAVRDLSARLALRGASLDASAVPDQGASMVLRVAAVTHRTDEVAADRPNDMAMFGAEDAIPQAAAR